MLKNFFSGYSQNGAAQAIVVLSAFTVAAEVIRTRSTGKRPYRDYGVGGMNELSHGHNHDDMYPTHQSVGAPHDWRETMAYGMDVEAQDYDHPMNMGADVDVGMAMDMSHDDDRVDAWAEMQAVRQQPLRQAAQGQSWSEGVRQQDHQVGRQQAGRQRASRQQVSRQQVYTQREDIEGSMAREASPWNRYVATEIPRLMAKGMSAPQAMKAASKSFRRRS